MPIYEYKCSRHGVFRAWKPMSESESSAACPHCGRSAVRMVSAPRLGIASDVRKVRALNEKSANEPRVVRKRRDEPIPVHDMHRDLAERHDHHHHDHADAQGENGKEIQRSTHPWAVRH